MIFAVNGRKKAAVRNERRLLLQWSLFAIANSASNDMNTANFLRDIRENSMKEN
jgi:hypothetical protein